MSVKSKKVHRQDLDGYTECGRLVEGSDLVVQPADGTGPPVDCGACIRQLSADCHTCETRVTGVRRREWDRWANNNGSSGAYLDWVWCPTCERKLLKHRPHKPGHHAFRLREKQRLEDQRRYRDQVAENGRRIAAEKRQRYDDHRAELGVLVDGCAICGASLPESAQRDNFAYLPREWLKSQFQQLGWHYCPEHAQLGAELEQTLEVTFCREAAALREQVVSRIQSHDTIWSRKTNDTGSIEIRQPPD